MSRQIPEGWKAGVLTDYAEINPRLAQRSELEEDTLVSFIRMEDVSNNAIVKNVRIVSYEQVSKGFTTFQDKDVLLAKITPCFENGKGGFVDNLQNGVGFGSTEFHVLRAKENSDPHFIYQVTNYPEFRIKGETNMTGSAGQRRVPTDYLKTFDVVFPPLPEQQKIATILTSVDTVIEKTRAQIDKLKHLKTGMMQELLTKGIGHTEFKNTPIGRIPKEWDVAAIADIARLTSGGTPNRENSDYWNGDVLWVKTGEVNYQTIFDTEEKITVLGLKESSAKLVPAGAILMAMYGQGITRGKVAKLGVPAAMNQACLAMIPNNQIINDFLYYFLSREYFNLRSMVQEGAQKNLSASIIKEILLPVPPRKEQQKIVDVLQSIDTKIMTASQKLISVEQTKKALMQDLLIGKIRVKLGSLGAFIE